MQGYRLTLCINNKQAHMVDALGHSMNGSVWVKASLTGSEDVSGSATMSSIRTLRQFWRESFRPTP